MGSRSPNQLKQEMYLIAQMARYEAGYSEEGTYSLTFFLIFVGFFGQNTQLNS